MTPQALAAVATLVSFAVHCNRVDLQLDRGSAELVWVSPSAFHFRRTLKGPLTPAKSEHFTDTVAFTPEVLSQTVAGGTLKAAGKVLFAAREEFSLGRSSFALASAIKGKQTEQGGLQ